MTVLPASGYWENNARTEGEGKQWGEDVRDVIAELPGGSAASMLTIVSGVIIPTLGCHTVEGEGAASDDLTNITTTNTPDGRLLLLTCYNAAHIITLKHAAGGAGQLDLQGAADVDLGADDAWILLKRTSADWHEITRSHHAAIHERASVDEIDGDHLDIDLTPTYYVPSTSPSEAANADDLAAHLYGIDQMLGWLGRGYLRRSKFTYNGGATAYTIKCEPAMYMCKEKICQWITELTTTAIGTPSADDWYYLYLDYSAITSTTAITNAELIWSNTEPAWNDTYMGWYNGDDRCIFAVRTNSGPTNISNFHCDGGEKVALTSEIAEYGAADPGTDFSQEITLDVPIFASKVGCIFTTTFVDGSPGFAYWRNTDDTSGLGSKIGLVSAGTTYCLTVADVFCNSDLKIDVKVSANDTLAVSTQRWYFPIGL